MVKQFRRAIKAEALPVVELMGSGGEWNERAVFLPTTYPLMGAEPSTARFFCHHLMTDRQTANKIIAM